MGLKNQHCDAEYGHIPHMRDVDISRFGWRMKKCVPASQSLAVTPGSHNGASDQWPATLMQLAVMPGDHGSRKLILAHEQKFRDILALEQKRLEPPPS